MIRNLNQMTFQEFGTILPEKAQSGRPLDKGIELEMKQGEAPVFRASSETWICGGNGMSVLSLSKDGENFQHFYLDKTVCIKNQMIYSVTPFKGDSSISMYVRSLLKCCT